MSKFKIGDRVKDISDHHVIFGIPAPALGNIDMIEDNSYHINWDDKRMGPSNWHDEQLEPVPPSVESPVRTVTRLEIVPGRYGRIQVMPPHGVPEDVGFQILSRGSDAVCDAPAFDAAELRAAARVFNSLAEALEDGK